jgi:hypothetical protein
MKRDGSAESVPFFVFYLTRFRRTAFRACAEGPCFQATETCEDSAAFRWLRPQATYINFYHVPGRRHVWFLNSPDGVCNIYNPPSWLKRVMLLKKKTSCEAVIKISIIPSRTGSFDSIRVASVTSWAVFSSSEEVLCKQKIPRHIKLTIHAWSTKCRWNQKLIVQLGCTLRDERFEPN